MRSRAAAVGLLCLFAIATGCETEQPLQVSERDLRISFDARAAVTEFFVYEFYWDVDQDGIPDLRDPSGNLLIEPVQTQCILDGTPPAPGQDPTPADPGPVPWPFTVQVELLRKGETEPEVVLLSDSLTQNFGLTAKSTNVREQIATFTQLAVGVIVRYAGANPSDPDLETLAELWPCLSQGAVCTPAGVLGAGHRAVTASTFDRREDAGSSNSVRDRFLRGSYCPGLPGIGEARLGGSADQPVRSPFVDEVDKGDTVIVKARLSDQSTLGPDAAQPRLNATVVVGGRDVTTTVSGNASSDQRDAAGISFSFTIR